MQYAIVLLVLVAVVVVLLFVRRDREQAVARKPQTGADFSGAKAPTSVEIDGATAVVTFDVEVAADGSDDELCELLVKQGRDALKGKGLNVDRMSVRAWRDGHVVEIASSHVGVEAPPAGAETAMPEAADFDPLGDLHATDFESAAAVPRSGGDLVSIGEELTLTDGVRATLQQRGVDVGSMKASELTVALLEASGYTVTSGSVSGTYDASTGAVRTFISVVDHEPGDYPELAEEAVDSFVIRFMSSGADRGLLFTDKYGPFSVYDKERREPRIRFITRERLQAFVDSVATR